MHQIPSKNLAYSFGCGIIVLGLIVPTTMAQQEENLDEWMSRVTGNEYSDTKPKSPESVAKTPKKTTSATQSESSSWLDEDSTDSESSMNYFRLRAGVNIMPDVKIKDIGLNATNLVGLSDAKLKIDPGIEFQLAYGRRLSDDFYIEFATQSAWNTVSGIEGTVYQDNGAGGIAFESPIEGGSGYLVQWPITIGIGYIVEFSDSIKLNLNAGAGIQVNFSYLEDPNVAGFGSSSYSWYYQTSFGFRGQAGANLSFAISNTVSLGIYGAWSAASSANFGKSTLITRSLQDQDLDAGLFMNYAIGGSLVIEF